MNVKEYRIMMPLSIEEYKTAQLYSCAVASQGETGGGEGVEVVRNENFDDTPLMGGKFRAGQYTQKIYHLASRIPRFIRTLLPVSAASLQILEEAWNAYPYCKTIITNPGYMGDGFHITIESLHLAGKGDVENALELGPEKLAQRAVIMVDIANDPVPDGDYKEEEDPSRFHSTVTNRGPLTGDWISQADPVMTCYKVVTAEFRWFGIQNRVENLIQNAERRIFTRFHRQMFCWIDRWHGLNLDDIRDLEERIRVELNVARLSGQSRGMSIERHSSI